MVKVETIKALSPCKERWVIFEKSLSEGQTEVSWAHIIEHNGIRDTFWVLARVLERPKFNQILWRFLLICERSLPAFEAKYPDDKRPHAVYALLRRQISGEDISLAEWHAARNSAAAAVAAAADADYLSAAAYAAYAAYAAAVADVTSAAADAADAVNAGAEKKVQKDHLAKVIEEVLKEDTTK